MWTFLINGIVMPRLYYIHIYIYIVGNNFADLSSESNDNFVSPWPYQFVFVNQHRHASLNF